jgi:GGDEF domain-containing protein
MFNEDYFELLKGMENLQKMDPSLPIYEKPAEPEFPDHIEKDSQFPDFGNLFSYKKFVAFNKNSGVHVTIDGNSVGALSDTHGQLMGDEGVSLMFNSILELSKKYKVHAFRVSGDKSRIIFKSPQEALGFTKELEQKLDETEVLSGTNHKFTVSVGIGYSPGQAEQALQEAKDILGGMINSQRVKHFDLGKEPFIHVSKLHEAPPDDWRPLEKSKTYLETIVPRGLKLQHPLK